MVIELKFKYGIEIEFVRVKNTLAKMDWYISQGYTPRLPDGIDGESSDAEIRNQIVKEFDKKRYDEMVNKLIVDFSTHSKQFSEKVENIFGNNVPKIFNVNLTNYGVGGSYHLPNVVIFNINMKKGIKTIIHEIMHLLIEGWIKKYQIQQWEKERIVDLILNSGEFGFLEYSDWQKDYHDTEKYIDGLFEKYFFENPENFFAKIESARQN
jgi:hypothetical protein